MKQTASSIFLLVVFGMTVCLFAGCQQAARDALQFVPVSGRVLLDGKPLADANVVFVPLRWQTSSGEFQPTSYGRTDSDGRFELVLTSGDPEQGERKGAVPGEHWVLISTRQLEPPPKRTEGVASDSKETEKQGSAKKSEQTAGVRSRPSAPANRRRALREEQVPDRFNGMTRLTFTVPLDGTDKADFDLPAK